VHEDPAAEVTQLVPVLQASAGSERLSVDRHRFVSADGLNEGHVIEHIEHHDRRRARTRQAQFAVAAGADAHRQTLCVYLPLAFDIPDD
jgi:hypothetical protein